MVRVVLVVVAADPVPGQWVVLLVEDVQARVGLPVLDVVVDGQGDAPGTTLLVKQSHE